MMRICTVVFALMLLAVPAFAQTDADLKDPNPTQGPFALQDCTPYLDYQQPLDPDIWSTARTSDQSGSFRVMDNFVDENGDPITLTSVSGMRFWGLELIFAGFLNCDETGNFTLNFYGSLPNGDPDFVPQGTVDCAATKVETGFLFGSVLIMTDEYSCDFAEVTLTGATWVEVSREQGETLDCVWLWLDENDTATYDNIAYQLGGTNPLTSDHTFCLSGTLSGGGGDGGGDDGGAVPATTGIGLVLMLLALGGGSAYFLRRK